MIYAHIIEADGNLSNNQRTRFGLATNAPEDSMVQVSVVKKEGGTRECLGTFYYVFDKVWAKANEALFWDEIKTRANVIVAANVPKIKQINDLMDMKISL